MWAGNALHGLDAVSTTVSPNVVSLIHFCVMQAKANSVNAIAMCFYVFC